MNSFFRLNKWHKISVSLRDSLLHAPLYLNRESCTRTHSLAFLVMELTHTLKHPIKRFKTCSVLHIRCTIYAFVMNDKR